MHPTVNWVEEIASVDWGWTTSSSVDSQTWLLTDMMPRSLHRHRDMTNEGGECTRTTHIHHRCLLLLGLVTINFFLLMELNSTSSLWCCVDSGAWWLRGWRPQRGWHFWVPVRRRTDGRNGTRNTREVQTLQVCYGREIWPLRRQTWF